MIKENIISMAKSRGLTISRLAERMGMKQGSLSQILSGNISTVSLDKIAAALEVEVWELFVSREEIEAERKRRLMALAVPRASVACPCCGCKICIQAESNQ